MGNFWEGVNRVIYQADILLLCLDARFVQETRNEEIEDKVLAANKPIIYVLTKSDLGSLSEMTKKASTLKPSVLFSSKDHHGTHNLEVMINKLSKGKTNVVVGVLGYPNVGKSSLINAMKGKSSLGVSPISGYTKKVAKIKARGFSFLDTPGVIPYMEKDEKRHAVISSIDYTRHKDPDLVVYSLMEARPGVIEKHYNVVGDDSEEIICEIAKKQNFLLKGNKPDLIRASRMILRDWQSGKIKHN